MEGKREGEREEERKEGRNKGGWLSLLTLRICLAVVGGMVGWKMVTMVRDSFWDISWLD